MKAVLDTIFSLNTLASAVRLAVPIALASVGGTFSERAGIINIGLEGMILSGAFAGALGTFMTGNPWLGVLFAMFSGGLLAAIFALFTIDLKANHVVAGVGVNILASGATAWLMQVIWNRRGTSPGVKGLPEWGVPFIKDIPVVGPLLGKQSPLVYIMLLIVIGSWILLFKTPLGLRIRMTGEHPEAADTLGINIRKIKYFSVITSGVLSGMGGAYLSLGHLNRFSSGMSAGRGYMALAANIFGQWNPLGGLGASFLFSYTDALQMRLQSMNLGIANEIIQMFPYIITVVVIAGAVVRSRPPEALGEHYDFKK